MKVEEDEYRDLSDTYNAAKAQYDRAYATAQEKIKQFEKESIKQIPYKQSIAKMICDLIPRDLMQELQLLDGAVDNIGTDGFLTAFGFLSHDPKLLFVGKSDSLSEGGP